MAIVLDGTAGITTPDLTDSSLTSGRVVYAGTGGNLTGSTNLTFDGANLTCGGTVQALGTVQSSSGADLSLNANGANRDVIVKVNGTEQARFVGSTSVLSIISGIQFPATQSASSNANTLDDYEEGTWTPAFAFGTSGSVTYSTQAGYYRKVGSLVFVECNIIIASVSSPTGNVTVNNLPFTVSSSTENVASLSLGLTRSLVNAKPDIKAYCANGTTQILFPVNDTISGSSELQGSDLKASTLIYCSGCFIAN
jgi:hypothetical protein